MLESGQADRAKLVHLDQTFKRQDPFELPRRIDQKLKQKRKKRGRPVETDAAEWKSANNADFHSGLKKSHRKERSAFFTVPHRPGGGLSFGLLFK